MNKLPDHAARLAALTKIDRSLLVEAGAGSGKTALLAGRVAVLLANGIEPKHIAAITFTAFAASELLIRIDAFARALARADVPREIAVAFPGGVSAEQRASLERACMSLDQLTCTTIHGFAQALIKPYPAEANIDPGAEIVDPAEADLAFEEHFAAWLRERLSSQSSDGIVAELVLADEGAGLGLVRIFSIWRAIFWLGMRKSGKPWRTDIHTCSSTSSRTLIHYRSSYCGCCVGKSGQGRRRGPWPVRRAPARSFWSAIRNRRSIASAAPM
jgi:hypothetical protein